jgi:hypothetical protein
MTHAVLRVPFKQHLFIINNQHNHHFQHNIEEVLKTYGGSGEVLMQIVNIIFTKALNILNKAI